MNRFLRIGYFLVIAVLFFWLEQKDFNFIDVYLFLFLLLTAIIFLAISLYKDIKEFKVRRTIDAFLPTLICLLVTLSVGGLLDSNSNENKSPIILFASHDSGVGGSWFEFRKDSTYKFTSGTPLGESTTEGTYQIKDSIILISRLPEGNLVKSNRLIIRYSPQPAPGYTGKTIWQTDNKGLIDSGLTVFTIYDAQASK